MAQVQEMKIYHLSREAGLSQSTVNCIIRDSTGYMWFGTNDGLNRYNGYEFTHFKHDPANPNSISLGRVFSVFLDSKGRLWSGTDQGGLNLFNPELDNFQRFSLNPDQSRNEFVNDIRAILETREGKLWIGTYGIGLWLFDPEEKTFLQYPSNKIELISDIKYDISGNMCKKM